MILFVLIFIVGLVFVCLLRWFIFVGGLEVGRNYVIGGLFVMFVLLIMYDVWVWWRLYMVSWVGMVLIIVSFVSVVFFGVIGIGYYILYGVVD